MNTAPTTGAEPAGAIIDGPAAAARPAPADTSSAPAHTTTARADTSTARTDTSTARADISSARTDTSTARADVPNRRERKKLQTRDALEAAAMKLFAARGYDATTVEEIAAEADVAVRTFFRYFGSKQDVLLGDVAHDVAGRLRAALEARPADETPVDAVGAALDSLELEGDDQRRQVLDRMWLVERVPELRGAYHVLFQELHDVIAEFVAARTGEAPQHLRPQLIASAAVGAIKTALTVLQTAPDGEPVGELRTRAYATLTAGLR